MTSCSYLCWLVPEPLWTNDEKEKFWKIFEGYLRQLVSGEMPLPVITLDQCKKRKRGKDNTSELYNSIIREYMWCGRYSLAVSTFKALNRSSNTDADDELKIMKKIFMDKPFRGSHTYGNSSHLMKK